MEAIVTTNKKYEIAFTVENAKVNIRYESNEGEAPLYLSVNVNYNENNNMGPGQGTHVIMNRTYYPDGSVVPVSLLKPFGQEFEDILETVTSGLFINNNYLDPNIFLTTI